MVGLFRSLLLVIAGSSQKELARQIRYLKVENQILLSKLPARITVTPIERQRLVKFGAKLGRALRQLVTIVAPGTLLRWIRETNKHAARPAAKRGRRRTPLQIRRLILKLARENGWGLCTTALRQSKCGLHWAKESFPVSWCVHDHVSLLYGNSFYCKSP